MRRIFAIAGVLAAGAGFLGGASAASASSLKGKVQPGGLPMIRDNLQAPVGIGAPTISINWSGYAALQTTSKFSYVFSTFVQPAVTCNGTTPEATSNWVGLDGYNDATVEQDGTFAICHGTTPTYSAWYEMYPAGSVSVFKVKPGDVMASSVRYKEDRFYLTISDLTTGKSYTDVAGCNSCERSSAEWIIERPAFCTNANCTSASISALANFGTTTMTDDVASAGTTKEAPITSFDSSPIEGVYNLDDNENADASGFVSVDTTGPVTASPAAFGMTFNRPGQPTPIIL